MTYIRNKRTKAFLLAVIFCMTYLFTFVLYIRPLTAYAATTGTVNGTSVRVRTSTDTSSTANVITKLNSPAQVTILDTVNPTDAYAWYKIGFDYNGTYTEGYIAAEFVTVNSSYSEDSDFEAYLNDQGFPESYKDGLRQLHAKYPKWVFKADHVDYDWNTVVNAESKTGKSLIYGSAASSWKSTAPDAYNAETGEWYTLDSGGWVAASRSLVAYALDPRNFLSSTYIFMFEDLAYHTGLQSEAGVNSIISGTFMEDTGTVGDGSGLSYDGSTYTYAEALMKAAQESGVSPYHLAARIIQEIGSDGDSNSISGTVGGYEGIYNYYNQGAYASGGVSAIINGLKYASNTDSATLRPWDSRMRSMIGGAIKIGSSYINIGQNSLYYEKFDLESGTYWHQYMTNILAPRSESVTSSQAYSDSMRSSTGLVFTIPVYQNMPGGICELPSDNKSPNNYLSSLQLSGTSLTPTFDHTITDYDVIVDNSVSEVTVSAEAMASSASINGVQTFELNIGTNTIHVVVTAENGDTRTYTINVVRQANTNNYLSDLRVSNGSLTPAFDSDTMNYDVSVENSVSQITVSAETKDSCAVVNGNQTFALSVGSNTIQIPVTAESGDVRTYTITVDRKAAPVPDNPDQGGSMSPNSYTINTPNNTISGVSVGNSISDVLDGITVSGSYSKNIVDVNGNNKSGKIATGDQLIISDGNGNIVYNYTFVVYGDVNGDGEITSMDLAYVKVHLVGIKPLSGVYELAGDAKRGGGPITSMDLACIKIAVLGLRDIVQQ